jgi:hypothetical protein
VARRPALLAATEATNRQTPAVRLLPDGLVTWFYTAWLRRCSGYLLTAS